MKNLKEKAIRCLVNVKATGILLAQDIRCYAEKREGLSHTVELLLWILGAIAIVGLIIGLITAALQTDIIPSIIQKIKNGF